MVLMGTRATIDSSPALNPLARDAVREGGAWGGGGEEREAEMDPWRCGEGETVEGIDGRRDACGCDESG